MNPQPRTPHAYRRPMAGWWNRDPYFVRYMARELTAFGVLAYAVVLAVGLVRLAQGEAAWNAWLAAVRSPAGWALHAVLLACMVVHSKSWFVIMPKTMPALFLKGRRVPQEAITRVGFAAAIACTLGLLAVAWGVLR